VSGYRIPGLATTNKGTLIGVYDIRRHGMRDLPGNVDIGMSRSTDGGQSWAPMKVIMDMGAPDDQNGIGDPTVLVDRKTNTIWVAAVWSHGNRAWHGSRPGMTPQETGQFMLVKSEDDGKTWSKPINITPQIKDPAWYYLLQGPGNGITMRDGTLVFPAQFKDHENMPHSTMIYSKDRGKTWTIGTGAKSNTTEAQIVELNDGSLMLNMRDNRRGSRSVYTTKDMGKSWQMHPTSRKALPEPTCMASLIRFSSKKDGEEQDILLFSNPNTSGGRRNITIKASFDEGMTWPEQHHKLIHEPNCAGYSCMTKVDDETVGILYEGGNTALLVFEKFRIDEIIAD
jgi:sialidase-1